MKNKLFYSLISLLFLIVILFVFFSYRYYQEKILAVNNTFQDKPFLAGLSYKKTKPLLFSKQNVLYDVTMLSYPFISSIDKIKFGHSDENTFEIEFINAHLDIKALILEKNPSLALHLKNLKDYIPYQDITKYPLLTLLLINNSNLNLDGILKITIFPDTKKALINGKIKAPHLFSFLFELEASNITDNFSEQLLNALINKNTAFLETIYLSALQYSWINNGFSDEYNNYLKTLPTEFVEECQNRYSQTYSLLNKKNINGAVTIKEILRILKENN